MYKDMQMGNHLWKERYAQMKSVCVTCAPVGWHKPIAGVRNVMARIKFCSHFTALAEYIVALGRSFLLNKLVSLFCPSFALDESALLQSS